jgi:hypothetical protein
MTARSHRKSVAFSHPFALKGIDRVLPPGDYQVATSEDRRTATMIFVPAESDLASSVEMVAIDPQEPQAAQERDQSHVA